MNTREAYIALNMLDGIGPIRARSLAAVAGSYEAIFTAPAGALARANGIGPELLQSLLEQRGAVAWLAELAKAEKLGARIITPADTEYPVSLRQIHDPPLALYIKGDLQPRDAQAIALVGSRRCSHYGLAVADKLAYELTQAGYTVVSGLARGIDTAAHQGALRAGGRTLAVLGCAIDTIYPPESEVLADKVTKQGCLISEYTIGRQPDRTTFPYRNRIVSGLCQGVVVVEAPARSGALITADMAMEQGRTVFAVPGRIDQPQSQGCHGLIKNGARLVEGVADIVDELGLLLPGSGRQRAEGVLKRPDLQLTELEVKIVRALGQGAIDVDTLGRLVELGVADLSAHLLALEMRRVIRVLPGNQVELSVRVGDF